MDNRKYCLNGILMIIMVLTVLMAYTAPAFAENAVADSAATVTADRSGNEKVKMDAAEENPEKNESGDLNKSDSDRDNAPSWDEIMKLLETMNGKAAQNDEENETEVRNGKKAYIGLKVSSLSDEIKAVTGVQAGVLVHQVKRNTPAARAGIQAYDIIVNVNGTDIASCEELASIITDSVPGDVLRIHLYRQGRMLEFDLSPIR